MHLNCSLHKNRKKIIISVGVYVHGLPYRSETYYPRSIRSEIQSGYLEGPNPDPDIKMLDQSKPDLDPDI